MPLLPALPPSLPAPLVCASYLGTLSFPIFIVHGALGQLFYKKIVATKVGGGGSKGMGQGVRGSSGRATGRGPAATVPSPARPPLHHACLPLAPSAQVWGAVQPLSFFPFYCLIVLAFAAACQHLFLVRGDAYVAAGRGRSGSLGAPTWRRARSPPRLHCLLQENKKVQEISKNITATMSSLVS